RVFHVTGVQTCALPISDAYIFKWQQGDFKVWHAEEGFGFASQVNKQLYIDKKGVGLMHMQNDSLILIPDGDKFVDDKGSITIMQIGRASCRARLKNEEL